MSAAEDPPGPGPASCCPGPPARGGRRRGPASALAGLLAALLVLAAVPTPPALQAAEPPVAGAGPTTASLRLGGRPTRVDIYAPTRAVEPFGAVVLAHGFTRTRATMAGHARALAADGHYAVAPDLPYALDSRDNARALRELVALLRGGARTAPVERVLLAGFSAGGLAALLATDAPGVVGYVGLDPFDRPGGVGLAVARQLAVPAWVVRAPPSACNAYAIAEPWVEAFPDLVADRVIEGASHCDFEAPTDVLCRVVCGGTDPARQAVVRAVLREAAAATLGGTAASRAQAAAQPARARPELAAEPAPGLSAAPGSSPRAEPAPARPR